jgi:DNA-binding transcriptional ArsR family regulator
VLRIVFTGNDIARTRIAARPDPLWELVMSVQMLRRQRGDLLFGEWRRSSIAALRRGMDREALRTLSALAPTIGYFPDFLTPIEAAKGMDEGLEAIRRTPSAVLRRDLSRLAEDNRLPGSVGLLARGDSEALIRLTDSMTSFTELAIAPYRRRIEAAIDRDRAMRVSEMMTNGVEGLLRSLRPHARWMSGELQVPSHRDQVVELEGRGLTLIPSYFNLVQPLTLFDPGLPPVLIYPVERPPETVLTVPSGGAGRLGPLIGATRTAMLHSIGTGRTTSDLARMLGISVASASEHATVLRDAHLINSFRDRNRMVHQLTKLGHDLLRQD